MTDAKPHLGQFGWFGRGVTPQQAKEIEALPVQVLTGPDKLVPALAELAGPLGLQ
jgi:hypothetical protein